jgi:hypothetical protein
MDARHLDILTRLDAELAPVDPELLALTEEIGWRCNDEERAALNKALRDVVRRFTENLLAPGHGPVTEADVHALFFDIGAGLPAGIDPAVPALVLRRVARLIEIAVALASDNPGRE